MLSNKELIEILDNLFEKVLSLYGEEALVYFSNGFYSAIQVMNEVNSYNEDQKSFEQSLKVAEAFQAYKNTGGIN